MDADTAAAFATSVVRSLTGYRWTWPLQDIIETFPLNSGGHRSYGPYRGWRPNPLNMQRRVIHLSGRPVSAVSSVVTSKGDDVVNLDGSPGWEVTNGYRLRLTHEGANMLDSFGCSEVTVAYSYGSPPPTYITAAIDALTAELEASGGDDCRLPERVTSVTRQGMSWTIIDPQEFLSKGRTGIYEVDMAIIIANPGGAKLRSRVFSPEFQPPRRTRG